MTSPKNPADMQAWSHHHHLLPPSKTGTFPAKRSNGAYSPVRDSQKMTGTGTSMAGSEASPADQVISDSATSPADNPGFQRSFKACDGCRTRKIKCELGDLAAPSEPPCARCKREMRPCQFTMSTRGRGPKARSSRSHAFDAHSVPPSDTTPIMLPTASSSTMYATRNDAAMPAFDTADATNMLYGLNPTPTFPKRRRLDEESPNPLLGLGGFAHSTSGNAEAPRAETVNERPESLQQYAEVGLQHSKDALRVLAGVAVDDASRVDAPPAVSSAFAAASRPITPPPLRHNYGWSKFEPVRLKLIKRSEARYFLNFFVRQMHSFAPHCSPHLLDKSPEALSELVCREPILLGAMLAVSSRYAVVDRNIPDTFHRKISKWTQEKISRSFFLPASHTIGTIEALLILSEWATLDLHDRRGSPDGSSESDDHDADDASDASDDQSGTTPGHPSSHTGRPASHAGQPVSHTTPQADRSGKQRQGDMRESDKFDDTAWMLTGTALRLAERLDLHNDATYSGISSRNVSSRRNAERRMRVWMSIVHADCHLSVRLGRRISSPGLAAPFTNLVRDRTHPSLLNSDMSTSATQGGFPSGSNRAWIAFRAHTELLQIVFRTSENLYRSKAVTERLLEDEDFMPALKSIRLDLDNWANWTQPRIEPTRDMTSLRVRVEYHYARLYANGIALDSVKRSLTTRRNDRQYRASEAAEIGSRGRLGKSADNGSSSGAIAGTVSNAVSFSTHVAYPYVREALAGAQSLIRILTVELESMMCAPARWFLLLVMAAIFCVKATAVSDTILPLKRCAQSLQQVITALEKAAPDGVHLANRYSMYLRQLAKQLVLTGPGAEVAPNTAAAEPLGWWSNQDVPGEVPGEVDPELFLKWLEEQTVVSSEDMLSGLWVDAMPGLESLAQ